MEGTLLPPFDNRVLLIEGRSGTLARIAAGLRIAGFDVEHVRSSAAALGRARNGRRVTLACVDGTLGIRPDDATLGELKQLGKDCPLLWVGEPADGRGPGLGQKDGVVEHARDLDELEASVTRVLSERLYPRYFVNALRLRTKTLLSRGFGIEARPLENGLGSASLPPGSASASVPLHGRSIEAEVLVRVSLRTLEQVLSSVFNGEQPTGALARDAAGEIANGVAGIVKGLLGSYGLLVDMSSPQSALGRRPVPRSLERPRLVVHFACAAGGNLFVEFGVLRFDGKAPDGTDTEIAPPGEVVFL